LLERIPGMEPLTVVIVEDEETHFHLMQRAMDKALPLASIHHFEQAEQCLARLNDVHPDVIVTDYLLPGMNGIEFLETLGQHKNDIPVIMITGQGDEDVAVRAMKLGAWDYMVKSGDFFALLPSVVEKVVLERELKEAWKRSETRFKEIFDRSPIGIEVYDRGGLLVDANNAALDALGISEVDEIRGLNLFNDPKILPETKDRLLKGKTVRHEVVFDFEKVKALKPFETTKSGIRYFYQIIAPLIPGPNHAVSGYLVQIQDVTEQRKAQEALEGREAQLRAIFEAAEDVSLIMTDLDGMEAKIVEFSPGAEKIFGYERDEVIGKPVGMLHLPEDIARFPEVFQAMGDKKRGFSGETILIRKSCKRFPALFSTYPIVDSKGNMTAAVGVTVDISKRKEAEEGVRTLTRALIRAQESERQKISRDLHDSVAQELSASIIACETLFDEELTVSPEVRKRVSELSKSLQRTIATLRDLSHDLRPAMLDDLGLVQTLSRYCEDFSENYGVDVEFSSAGMDRMTLDSDTEINLYRIVQEALNNIRKHADASHVTIRLMGAFPDVILRMVDNGTGFDVADRLVTAPSEKRMGICSMRERAGLLGGKMTIQSKSGQGTTVIVEVPCELNRGGAKENRTHR
jgi:PAS domain S-box-containing protein